VVPVGSNIRDLEMFVGAAAYQPQRGGILLTSALNSRAIS